MQVGTAGASEQRWRDAACLTGWQQTLRSSIAKLRKLGRFLALQPVNNAPICSTEPSQLRHCSHGRALLDHTCMQSGGRCEGMGELCI